MRDVASREVVAGWLRERGADDVVVRLTTRTADAIQLANETHNAKHPVEERATAIAIRLLTVLVDRLSTLKTPLWAGFQRDPDTYPLWVSEVERKTPFDPINGEWIPVYAEPKALRRMVNNRDTPITHGR